MGMDGSVPGSHSLSSIQKKTFVLSLLKHEAFLQLLGYEMCHFMVQCNALSHVHIVLDQSLFVTQAVKRCPTFKYLSRISSHAIKL